jgi:hypothetical protein
MKRGIFEAAALHDEMVRQNLYASRMVVNQNLVLDDADIPIILKLVNETLYLGSNTETARDVSTRSKRST